MTWGSERVARIVEALAGNDALVCCLPENVLLLTGYWPVVGTSIAIATADGRTGVLAPEDESDLAHRGWADRIYSYAPGSLEEIRTPEEACRGPLTEMCRDLGIEKGRIAYEDFPIYIESSYAAMHLFDGSICGILTSCLPQCVLTSGKNALTSLRKRLTAEEVDFVRRACGIAGEAFESIRSTITVGNSEPQIAAALRTAIEIQSSLESESMRSGAFTWCMSGPNSALAGAAYARTRARVVREGDLVLLHCNSYLDGYWTDITRTYCVGDLDDRKRDIFEAIFAARQAALSTIRPGARAADVDRAAREVLDDRGLGEYFTHGLGHSVGFSAISTDFPPRIHPASSDVLAVGMTFNVEPSVYIPDYGGVRHCDVVTVREDGVEVLTPFGAEVGSQIVDV